MYDPELDLAREVATEVRGYFEETVFRTMIPRDVHVSEAPSHGQSVLDYCAACPWLVGIRRTRLGGSRS